nr:MAG TPA: hypothetical protein [Caudoviricetes sp.]
MNFLFHTLEISLIFINLSFQVQFGVHFHLQLYLLRCWTLLERIIFIHLLRSTLLISLS